MMKRNRRRLSSPGLNIEELIADAEFAGKDLSGKSIMLTRLGRGPISMLIGIMIVVGVIFLGYVIFLVNKSPDSYARTLYRNRLASEIVFAPRGAILDRNDRQLAASTYNSVSGRYEREVADIPGIGSLMGFIRYPEQDASGYYWRFSTEGVSGLEKFADSMLKEYPGYRLRTRERSGQELVFPEDRVVYPQSGKPLKTTLDYDLNKKLGESMVSFIKANNYEAGAGVIMNVRTGEILAMVSLPDIDPDALSNNEEGIAEQYLNDPNKPMLNRVVFGGYNPGSTVKPYLVTAFLNEGTITPTSVVNSVGKIKVINPYTKGQDYTFRDWRPLGHGVTNARWALADSVNTFFYVYGGGYGGVKGLGIKKIKEYMQKFGLGERVPFVLRGTQPGQVPDPAWKMETFGESWRVGDTYNSSIGQYGFVVTPLQQLRAVAALATSGLMIQPIILSGQALVVDRIPGIEEAWYQEVRAGMRDVVTIGTGQSMNVPAIEFAAKTGTAQVLNKTKINSWTIGFWPYNEPQYAFVLLAERGPKEGAPNVSHAWRTVINWMIDERTEYFIPAPGYEALKASPKKISAPVEVTKDEVKPVDALEIPVEEEVPVDAIPDPIAAPVE